MKKNISCNPLALGLCIAGVLLGCARETKADTSAFDPTLTLNGSGSGNDGLFFTPNTSLMVTSLGYVDCGFTVGHNVGLYDVSTATLLASTTVTILSSPSGGFYYNLISPLILTAGTEYALVGTQVPADSNFSATIVGPASDITYDGYFYDYNSSLDLPSTAYPDAFFGPNLQYVPVPEPTMFSCLFLGYLILISVRRFILLG